jgi:enterochelin esterase-like enzyme
MRTVLPAIVLTALALFQVITARAGELRVNQVLPSAALGQDLPYSIYLPFSDGVASARYPVVYLLHGFGGGQHEWRKGGRIAETLDRLIESGAISPVITVMPEAGKSWYVDSKQFGGPGDYETAITRDLVAGIDRLYPTLADARHRGIAGVSMGGHGALRLAFAHPEIFSAVAALSPGIWQPGGVSEQSGPAVETAEEREKWHPRTTGQTFDMEVFNAQSPFSLIGNVAQQERAADVFLAVGDDDYWILYDGTVEMYIELRRIGLKPELRVGDGGHNWKFWRLMTEDVFHFFDANLRAAK